MNEGEEAQHGQQAGADGNPGTEVQAFLQGLKHSRNDAVEAVRETILSAHPGISEQIKWNAPSFGIDGDDRITFRLQPGDRVQLVFHRGAQKRDDATRFSFQGSSGLLEWVTRDRALVTFGDLDDVEAKSAALQDLVRRWMIATSRDPKTRLGAEPTTRPLRARGRGTGDRRVAVAFDELPLTI